MKEPSGGFADGGGWRPTEAAVGGDWQVNVERTALANLTFNLDPTLVLLDDALHHGQAQPCALTNRFGRKKRFKQPAYGLAVHAATGVGNR